MRVIQFAAENKAYFAIAGGITVFGLSMNEIAALFSIMISVMVIVEKSPAFGGAIKGFLGWLWRQVKNDPVLLAWLKRTVMGVFSAERDFSALSLRRKTKFRARWLLLALLSIIFFSLLFIDLKFI